MCASAFLVLFHSDPNILAPKLLSFVPDAVKGILGRPGVSVEHLSQLPSVASCRQGGCYLSIATKEGSITTYHDKHYETGVYVGSTMNSKGGFAERIHGHNHAARKVQAGSFDPRTQTKHYRFIGREGVNSMFLLLALIPLKTPAGKLLSLLLEAIFQAYLNIVADTELVTRWHRPAVARFITHMRSFVDASLPDLAVYGLNAAWSLAQGGFKVPKGIRDQPCALCPPGFSIGSKSCLMYPGDILGPRICYNHWYHTNKFQNPAWIALGPCARCHRKREGTKTPFTMIEGISTCQHCIHRLALRARAGKPPVTVEEDARNHGGCAWCGAEEFEFKGQVFYDMGEDRRCRNCFVYREMYGTERDPEL